MGIIKRNGIDYSGGFSDISEEKVKFESADELEPESLSDMPLLSNNSPLKTLMRTISIGVKNLRYLIRLIGTTDISAIGDGTVTGAVNTLDDNIKNLTAENVGAVPTTGGEFTGRVYFNNGTMVTSSLQGIDGVNGYVKIAQIKIQSGYIDNPFVFEITGRGWVYTRKLYVCFQSSSNYDPELKSFLIDNSPTYPVCLTKSSTSTWDIYMRKNGEWGRCYICSMHRTPPGTTVLFPNTQISTLPDGYIVPTVITWNKADVSNRLTGMYAVSKEVMKTNTISIKTKFPNFNGGGDKRQSIFVFGRDNSVSVYGLIVVSDRGNALFSGIPSGTPYEVTVNKDQKNDGTIVITLPTNAYDYFTFMSGEFIS